MADDRDKAQKLEKTITELQDRWGNRVIGQAKKEHQSSMQIIPTGFPALDKALVIGGLPGGRISELIGIPTSGMATIALKIVANAQERLAPAIYIDLERTFDPDYAVRCGLRLEQLVLVRPADIHHGLGIMQDFITGGGISILVFDSSYTLSGDPKAAEALARTLSRIIAPLARSNCVLLFLTSLPVDGESGTPALEHCPATASNLPHYAVIRLFIRRERWIYKKRDISGYQAQVQVIKNKLGPAGKEASLAITFDETVSGP